MVASSSSIWASYKFNNPYKYMLHQLLFAFIGFLLMYICSKTDFKLYKKHANKILMFNILQIKNVIAPVR